MSDIQVVLDRKAPQVIPDHKDHKDLPDQMVLLDLLAQADQVDLLDIPVHLEQDLAQLDQQHLDKLQFTMAQHQ